LSLTWVIVYAAIKLQRFPYQTLIVTIY